MQTDLIGRAKCINVYYYTMKRFVMDIPDDLHQRLKAACALQGKTMKRVAQKLLEEYVQESEKKLKK
jgi:hypothetical protein